MERKEQEPFDREAWRRLLGADSGAPTKEIDRRILAGARRALAPRNGRWWLPASLAASLLLAVLIVQWQLADTGRPVPVTESDVLAVPTPGAADENAATAASELPAQPKELPAAVPAEVAPMPEIEERASLRNQTAVAESASDSAAAAAPAPAQAQTGAESAPTIGLLKAEQSRAKLRTPEQWYADIEALRAAGRIKEADAELVRLKSTYPGWLESHQKKDP